MKWGNYGGRGWIIYSMGIKEHEDTNFLSFEVTILPGMTKQNLHAGMIE